MKTTWKVGTKIAAGLGAAILLLVVIAVMGYLNMRTINESMETMYEDRLVPLHEVGQADAAFYKARGELYKFILIPEERAEIEVELNTQIATVDKMRKDYGATTLAKEEKDELDNFDKAWAAYKNVAATIISQVKAGRAQEALSLMSEGQPHSDARKAVAASIDNLAEINERMGKDLDAQGHATFNNATRVAMVLSLIAIVLALAIGIALTRNIARPLGEVARAAERIAAGDLTVSFAADRGDEVGDLTRAFRTMTEKLRGQLVSLKEGIDQLAAASSQILTATVQMAASAAEAATAVAETTTTVDEVGQAAQISNEKAKHVASSSQQAEQFSLQGKKAVEENVGSIGRIREQMEAIAESIVRLSEQSQTIGGVIATVSDLADQSNLLAVNASIEAAKAGEQGKGFAVVAQEVKSLAEQSKQATVQVRGILTDIQKATGAAVMATEQGSKTVDSGVAAAGRAGEAIGVLSETITESAQAAQLVAVSSQQQQVGMSQIALAVKNISQAASQVQTGAKQQEQAAQNLNDLGRKLKQLVETYKL